MPNLATLLVHSAERFPQRVALRCNEQSFTFAEFDDAAARLATALEREGVAPGDRVGIMLPNSPAFAVLFYATLRRGAVAVPMNPLLKSREVEFYLNNTGRGRGRGRGPRRCDGAGAGRRHLGRVDSQGHATAATGRV